VSKDLILKSYVYPEFAGLTLIDYLTKRFTYATREQWLERLNAQKVQLNQKIALSDQIVQAKDELSYAPGEFIEPPVSTHYQILFEDADLLVVDKPAPLPVHPIRKYYENSLLSLLQKRYPGQAFYPVHRIDLETSGIVIFAKNNETASSLGKMFIAGAVQKTYLAAVFGRFTENEKLIDLPIAKIPKSNTFEVNASGKASQTRVKKISTNEKYSLLEVQTLTGRPHQIRVHLQAIGFPIVGDKRYGLYPHALDYFIKNGFDQQMQEWMVAARQLLHANRIELIHPQTNQKLEINSELPEDFKIVF
jgi:RluA family pseudouridine synthase